MNVANVEILSWQDLDGDCDANGLLSEKTSPSVLCVERSTVLIQSLIVEVTMPCGSPFELQV